MLNFRLDISYPKAGIAGPRRSRSVWRCAWREAICPIILTCDAEHTLTQQVPSLDQASIEDIIIYDLHQVLIPIVTPMLRRSKLVQRTSRNTWLQRIAQEHRVKFP